MGPEQDRKLKELHNEHADIWREMEQCRTDLMVSERNGNKDVELESQFRELEAKLKEKEQEIEVFTAENS